MSLRLYFHPLSSYCHKALIALYENDTPFEPRVIDLGNPTSRAELTAIWPIGKFPVLRDDANDRTIPESTGIVEYLAEHYPGTSKLVPADPDRAMLARIHDRFFDFYLNDSVGKIVTDRLRPAGKNDTLGVEQAKAVMGTALDMVEKDMRAKIWATGDDFTMADCAAAPALFYANIVMPFGDTHPQAARYLGRLMERPSFARVVREAQPYLAMMPK